MKKKIWIIILLMVAFLVTGCEKTDGEKFAKEYTSLNGTKSESGKTIRSIKISSDNPFVYQTAEEIAERIENKESFIVYFGFAKCPWCRSVLEQLIKVAKDKNIKTIYYVDVLEIRDVREMTEDGEVNITKEGTKGYQKLLTQLEDVLSDYTTTVDEETLSLGEKRIYAPNVVAVHNGKALQMETGISEELKDPYGKLTEDIRTYAYNKFKCLVDCLEEESNTCQKNMC